MNYLKSHNKFYEDVTIRQGLSSNDMINFTDVDFPVNDEIDEISEDHLSKDRVASNETALISEIPSIVDNENLIVAPGQGKTPVSIASDELCEELAFPYLFPSGKFGYKVDREVSLSPVKYFNQRLLNFKQNFASDADYIFFARSVVEQHHLYSSISIAMQKMNSSQMTAGTIRQNYKETIQNFLAKNNAFSFMNSVKDTPAYWKQFLYEVLAMIKQLGIPTFFLTLSCADLRWDELPYIINKLNNLGLTDDELKNLSYEECCKYLNSNPVLVARHFQYRVQTFLKEIILNGSIR